MPVNLGLLSDASISGLPEETQNQLQKQATMQMIWGALLGDPAMGFKSAQDIPTRFIATQSHLQDLQTKQKQLAEIESWKSKYTPSQIQAMTSAEGMVSPDIFGEGTQRRPQDVVGPPTENVYNAQRMVAQNILNRPIDQTKAIRDLLNISGNPAAPNMLANLQALQSKTQGNLMIDPNGNITSVLPQINKEGTVTTGTVEGGVPTFKMAPIANAAESFAQTTLPPLEKGQEYLFNSSGKVSGIRNASGFIQAISESESAKEQAKQEAMAKFAIEPSVNPITGETTNRSRLDIIKGLNPSPQQAPKPDLTEINKQTEALNQKIKAEGYSDENKRLFADLQTRKNAILQGQPTVGQPNISKLSPMSEAQMGEYAPILKDARKKYDAANQRKGVLDQIQNDLNNPNFDTNFLTEYKTKMLSALQSVGATSEKANSYLNSAQSARQGFANLTAANISEQIGAISDKDIDFNKQRFAQITDTKQAVEYAIALQKASDKKSQQYYDFVSKNPVANVNQAWSESQKGQESIYEDPSLRKYLPQAPVKGGGVAHQLPSGKWVKF